MNERELAESVVRKLDEGLESLPAGTLYRLRLARDAALSRAHLGTAASLDSADAPRLLGRRLLIPVFGLMLALSLLVVWHQQSATQPDYAEIDAQVLSDELPVTAYLDSGFEVWLHHHATD